MELLLIEKLALSFITLGILTVLIIGMYLDKNSKATQILNREVENFSNQKKQRDIDEKDQIEEDYQSFQYEPYEKQEGFKSNPKSVEGMKSIGDQILSAFTKPFKPLIDFFNKLIDAFKQIPRRVNDFSAAFKYVGIGIEDEFKYLGLSLKTGFNDVFNVVGTLGNCGINYLTNFRTCIMWYILDCIGSTIYAVFVALPIWIFLQVSGKDLEPYVVDIICQIDKLDALCFKYTCFHFCHFPDWVIRDCFTCNFESAVATLKRDWTVTIPEYMNRPNQDFNNAKDKFKASFS